jgi:hypothetical protein
MQAAEVVKSRRVAAGGVLLAMGALSQVTGWVLLSHDWVTQGRRTVDVVVFNRLQEELAAACMIIAGFLFILAAVGMSGAVSGRGARITQAGIWLLALGAVWPMTGEAIGGPLDALAAYYPPAGFTHQQVIEVQHQMAWPLALLFVSFPLLNLAPVVLLSGLFRARVIPFWPLPIWILGVVIFVQLADRNGATRVEHLIGLAAFAAAYLGGPGWAGLALARRAIVARPTIKQEASALAQPLSA